MHDVGGQLSFLLRWLNIMTDDKKNKGVKVGLYHIHIDRIVFSLRLQLLLRPGVGHGWTT